MSELSVVHDSVLPIPGEPHGRRAVTAIAGIGALMVVFVVIAAIGSGTGSDLLVESYTLTNITIGISLLGSGSLIGWFRPSNAVGWLFLACGSGHLLSATVAVLLLLGTAAGWPTLLTRTLTTLFHAGWIIGIPGLFLLALLLFPTGQLLSRRWMPVAAAIIATTGYNVTAAALSSESLLGSSATVSVLSSGYRAPEPVELALNLVSAALFALVTVSLVVRYRRGGEEARRQLLWLILAVVAVGLLNSQRWITGDGPILLLLSIGLIPVAVAIAIVRYRLLDIRLVLSRTLVYTLAVATTIVVYGAIVGAFALLFPSENDLEAATLAVILVAIAFNPVRLLLHRLISRAFYGSRADIAGTALKVADRIQGSGDDLSALLDGARADLRLPYLAVKKESDATLIASSGELEDHARLAAVPLRYRGKKRATLLVGLRRGEWKLHDSDLRVLSLIAAPLAVAQHAIELTEEVRAARASTVQAREWERKRLHRELHDGLGPDLTSIALRADAAYNLIPNDPDLALVHLAELRQQVRSSINDVRRVVYGLRPMELDRLGFVEAIRRKIANANGDVGRALSVSGILPDIVPELSPATELATYRIVSEGLENVLRHSDATSCTVTISVADDLRISVKDNGSPVTTWIRGVGINSIVDRAEELGGSASVSAASTGWRVEACIPFPATNEAATQDSISKTNGSFR
ncbi:sensor histidine kinase [Arthrobacter sp. CAL618]|uniref:sensor histidine kinase n=1 Tax=Arthrobacter sp. CAL618 TaxID=1055770 RepID=UPI000401F5CE|nr:sensor histidine kinase [Arthrobacter sp. CAL618]